MFAIAVPSTLTLTTPSDDKDGEPTQFANLEFFHPSDDVSKCRVRLTTADGDVHEATFNTQGGVVDRYYASADEIAERERARDAEAEAEREREQEVAHEQSERELKTADDTTAADLSNDAPQGALNNINQQNAYRPEPVSG